MLLSWFALFSLCRINGQGGCGRLNLLFLLARPQVLQRRFAALFSLVGKKYQKSTRRGCAPSRLPWIWGTICTFFACTKKVPKKYTEGLRALLTPGNAVKLPLRNAPHVLRRYLSSTVCGNARKRSFYLLLSDCGLTQQCFLEILGFLLYWVLVLYPSFRAGVYGTKTGTVLRRINFVIFACSSASIAAALRRTFFACTKKVPKKYTEGLRALPAPGDAVKLRLRFAPQVLRRYRKFHIFIKRKNTHFIFMP